MIFGPLLGRMRNVAFSRTTPSINRRFAARKATRHNEQTKAYCSLVMMIRDAAADMPNKKCDSNLWLLQIFAAPPQPFTQL